MSNILYNPKSTAPAVYIPAWLSQISTNQLTCTAKMIYGRLAQWANQNGKAHRSATQLSEELGIPERSIKRGIKELKECGLIGSYLEVDGGHNHYEFYQHSWMNEPINKNLCYQDDDFTPHAKMARGCAKMARGCAKMAHHKIKEIKENKKLSVGDSSNPNTHTDNSPKKPKKELVESNTLHDEEVKKLFEEKFGDYNLTIEQLFMACQEHYEQKSLWVTKDKFVKWIKKEKLDIYTKKGSRLPSKIPKTPEQIKKEQLNKNYNLYYSQFINDRDVLKISDTQNKEPLSFKQWKSLQDNIIPLVANQ